MSVQQITQKQGENAQTVIHAGGEARGRRFCEISRRHRNLYDAESLVNRLHEHFLIENKIVGIQQEWNFLQYPPAECAISGMIFRELLPQHPILNAGQKPVTQEFPPGHALLNRISSQ